MKKIRIILLTILICLPIFSSAVKAEEIDAGDNPLTIFCRYDVATTGKEAIWNVTYTNDYFRHPASQYDHALAQLSLGMAISAFRPNLDPTAADYPSLHLEDFLSQCFFFDLRSDDYDKNPTLYTVSTVIGHRPLHDDEGEFQLIAVGVCGQGYKNEWMSNFTCGYEQMHEGFVSAASEVYDRIFGYIAQTELYGQRMKIWISGFSRAAAISNLVAKFLVDSPVFDTSNVYAYTFATPRNTTDNRIHEYTNIFNICGKMDPVTQVAFADWGFDRYGTTLYTPAQETDSDYFAKQGAADLISRERLGIGFWNNVELDTKLRVILNYLLKLAPTSKIYTEHIQEKVISIWEDKSLPNILTNLMSMAEDEELINDSNKAEANSMLTYIAYAMYGYATNNEIAAKYRNDNATLAGNFAREHTPEVYLCWMFSTDDPKELFTNKITYLRVVVAGDVDVAIFGRGEYNGLVKYMKADGTTEDTFDYDGTSYIKPYSSPDIFMERVNGEHIILMPKDTDYDIIIKSNADQRIEVHAIQLKVGYTNGDFSKMHYADVKAGEYDVVSSNRHEDIRGYGHYDIVAGDTFDVVSITNGTSAELAIALERVNILNLSWQQMVLIIVIAPVVIGILFTILMSGAIGKHRIKRKIAAGELPKGVRYDYLPTITTSVIVGLFIVQELLYWLMPQYLLQRGILKLVIGALLLLMAFLGYRKDKTKTSRNMMLGIILCIAADISITFNFTLGMMVYAIAELFLIYTFLQHEEPDTWQIIFMSLGSIIISVVIYLVGGYTDILLNQMIVYSSILVGMFTLSLNMPKKIRAGAILLLLSNVVIFINEVSVETLYGHVLALALYYIAISCFAHSTRFSRKRAIFKKQAEEEPVTA